MDKKFGFTDEQIDIINSISDENVKLKVIEQFTTFNIRLSEEETKRCCNNKSFGTNVFDSVSKVATTFIENIDKIVDTIEYAEHVKNEYDRKYHSEKIDTKDVPVSKSPEMEMIEKE